MTRVPKVEKFGYASLSKGNKVIVNTTRITVRPENRNELFQTIWPLLEPIRSEKGCLTYHFYVDASDENSTVLIGEWETPEDWHNHLRSAISPCCSAPSPY